MVLTWGETPNDLDSHLFTSSGSDTQQVWYSNRSDDYGNWLDVDDTSSYGPETITISQFDASKYYKYCVVDFTNSGAGNTNSTEMSYSGANVSVYNNNGLIASYNMPKNVNALVWEVFEIRNGVVSPIQRYYNNNSVENNYWWDGNNDSDWAQAYLDLLNSKTEGDFTGGDEKEFVMTKLLYCSNDNPPVLCINVYDYDYMRAYSNIYTPSDINSGEPSLYLEGSYMHFFSINWNGNDYFLKSFCGHSYSAISLYQIENESLVCVGDGDGDSSTSEYSGDFSPSEFEEILNCEIIDNEFNNECSIDEMKDYLRGLIN